MSPFSYFIMMDFMSHRFHIYFGNMNDPKTWEYRDHSFSSFIDAEDKLIELNTPPEP